MCIRCQLLLPSRSCICRQLLHNRLSKAYNPPLIVPLPIVDHPITIVHPSSSTRQPSIQYLRLINDHPYNDRKYRSSKRHCSTLSCHYGISTPPRPPLPAPILDPFESDDLFDLSSRVGSLAYSTISSPLDDIWDGSVSTFPSFVVALRLRTSEGKWNKATDPGILTFGTTPNTQNIFTDYHSISDAVIETARVARITPHAIQNSKAMFKCIKSPIKGDFRDTIFTKFGNLPAHEDGIGLFKKLTTFMAVASLQLSMLSFQKILDFSPSLHDFCIPKINNKLIHLFILATTQSRTLLDAEKIQHTMNVYAKIFQPESWA